MASMSGGQNPTDAVLGSPDWSLRTVFDVEDVRAVPPAGWSWPQMVHQRRDYVRFDLPIPQYAALDLGSIRYEREVAYAQRLSQQTEATILNKLPDDSVHAQMLSRETERVMDTEFPLVGSRSDSLRGQRR